MAAEFDELYRDAVSLIAHDLRGAASALALRADVLVDVLPPRDREAFKSLSTELLDIDHTLQLMQRVLGTSGSASEHTLGDPHWWHMTTRLSANVLPRGSRQVAECESFEVTSREASLFTHAWLAACKGLASCSEAVAQPIHARLELRSRGETDSRPSLELAASATFTRPTAAGELQKLEARLGKSRWLRYANRIARKHHATMTWWTRNDATFVWKCSMRSGAQRM